MKAVDILGGVDALHHHVGVEMLRQRQLDEDAVHRGIGVQAIDKPQEFVRLGVGREPVLDALDPRLAAGLAL